MRSLRLLSALTRPDGVIPPGVVITVDGAEARTLMGAIGLVEDLGLVDGAAPLAAPGAVGTHATPDDAAMAAGPVAPSNAGDLGGGVAGTHAKAEGGPEIPAAPASAAGAAEGAGQAPAAEGDKPAANPAEGAADAPAVPAAKTKPRTAARKPR